MAWRRPHFTLLGANYGPLPRDQNLKFYLGNIISRYKEYRQQKEKLRNHKFRWKIFWCHDFYSSLQLQAFLLPLLIAPFRMFMGFHILNVGTFLSLTWVNNDTQEHNCQRKPTYPSKCTIISMWSSELIKMTKKVWICVFMMAFPINVAPKKVEKGTKKWPQVIPAKSNRGFGTCKEQNELWMN